MRAVICDGCQKRDATVGPMAYIPTGWVTVTIHDQNAMNDERHYCGKPCAVIALTEVETAALKKMDDL